MARDSEGVLKDESHDEPRPASSDIDAGACGPYCGSAQAPFIAYEAIRDALVARGIPPHEIAFIQQARNKHQREQLMAAVRSGAVRVLLAGSQNTGLNVQERLLAVHNADVPWRPGDLEQRIGRAQRQGNGWPAIYVCNYAVEGSFDSFIWQANEVKAQFITQFERGDVSVREIDDIGGIVMTAAEMKAIASGNPQVRRKFQVESELARLDLLAVAANDTRRRMHTRIREIDAHCEGSRATQSLLRAACAAVEAATTPDFEAWVATTLGAPPYLPVTKRGEAGAAVRELALAVCQLHGIAQLERHELWRGSCVQRIVLATYRGLLLECVVGRFGQAALMLALPGRREEAALIPETTLAATTERGIFDSADAAIRQFSERVAEIDRRIAQLEGEQRNILAALDQPWEHEAAYRALCEERDALLQALAPKDEASNTMASNDPPASEAATPAASTEQVNTALTAPSMVAQPVMLPPLRDPQDMQAARERIKALDRKRQMTVQALDERVIQRRDERHIPIEPPGPVEEAQLADVRRFYRPASAPVFGDVTAVRQSGRRRTVPNAERVSDEPTEQLSLFG